MCNVVEQKENTKLISQDDTKSLHTRNPHETKCHCASSTEILSLLGLKFEP